MRTARRDKLIGHLYYLVQDLELGAHCPPRALDMLTAARYQPAFIQTRVKREVHAVLRALGGDSGPLILLKGAAYLFADYPLARGRPFADVDILVPRSRLHHVEQRLIEHGWEAKDLHGYDQRYYREWMHEIPPLTHPARGMEVDIHHTLLPLTARLHPDPELLWQASLPLGEGPLRVLAPADMVLHSAAHLFYDGEIAGSLRDLVDLHHLLAQFDKKAGFWADLLERARLLELDRPLYYAVHFCRELLETGVPEEILRKLEAHGAPSAPVRMLMDLLVKRVLRPRLPGEGGAPIASWLLYVRSHWLRMPPWLLAQHLSRKAWRRMTGGLAEPVR